MEVDIDVSPTSVEKSELNILAKNFPYQEFMDQMLMTPANIEQFREDEMTSWKSSNRPSEFY